MAAGGIGQLDSALRTPLHASGWTNSWPVPWWTIFRRVGSAAGAGFARPAEVSRRKKCFIETVSPARNSVRSNTVAARASGSPPAPVGWLKRHDSMPFCQLLKTNDVSGRPLASGLRAVTNKPLSAMQRTGFGFNARAMRASPCASVAPDHSGWPLQSFTVTCAPSTGLPRSSVVTQTTLFSRPSLKCTPRLVTSTPLRTNIGARLSSSDWPRRSDSISTTW